MMFALDYCSSGFTPMSLRLTTCILIGLLIGVCTLRMFGQTEPGGLRLEDILNIAEFAPRQPVDLSPDGEQIAAALVPPARAAALAEPYSTFFSRSGVELSTLGAGIWVVNARTRVAKNITGGQGTSWGPAWSPDGRLLAFYSDRDGAARLWIWDRERGTLRRGSEAVVRPDFGFEIPRWSPDGRRVLVQLLPEGLTLEQAAAMLPKSTQPGGVSGSTNPPAAPGVSVFASDPQLLLPSAVKSPTATSPPGTNTSGVSVANSFLADLAIVDVASGRVERIARRASPLAYSFSPDGRKVLYTDRRAVEVGGRRTIGYDVVVVDLADGKHHVVAPGALRGYGLGVSWDPQGQRIAYMNADGNLVVVGADKSGSGAAGWRELARFTRSGVSFRSDFTPPLWSQDGRRLYVLAADTLWEASLETGGVRPVGTVQAHELTGVVADVQAARLWNGEDGRTAYVIGRDQRTGRTGFFRMPLAGGSAEPRWQSDIEMGPLLPFVLDVSGRTVAFVAQDATHPQELWISRDELQTAERVSQLHQGLERYKLGQSRLVEWKSTSGAPLRGALLLPPNYQAGKRYPVIVHVYPGKTFSARVNRFGLEGTGIDNRQLLTSRGYVLFFPDVPLSGGKVVEDLTTSVLPGVDRLVELGIADPKRIGVTGASFGGYATVALLTATDRFTAAIAEQGFGNLLSHYARLGPDGTSPGVGYVERDQPGMGGPPWGARLQQYIEQSPFFRLDKITTPLLLIHGEADRVVPARMSEEIFVGLRRLEKPVVLAVYRGEGHGVGAWSRPSLEDYWNRVAAWWDRWLGGNQTDRANTK